MLHELKTFLYNRCVATSRSTSDNGQGERYNSIIWIMTQPGLRSNDLPANQWDNALVTAPVSYTHLDVYKRQMLYSISIPLN